MPRLPAGGYVPAVRLEEGVEKAFKLIAESNLHMKRLNVQAPPMEQVIKYYEERAPLELLLPVIPKANGPLPLRFQRTGYPVAPRAPEPAVANVNLVHLFDDRRLDVLACD